MHCCRRRLSSAVMLDSCARDTQAQRAGAADGLHLRQHRRVLRHARQVRARRAPSTVSPAPCDMSCAGSTAPASPSPRTSCSTRRRTARSCRPPWTTAARARPPGAPACASAAARGLRHLSVCDAAAEPCPSRHGRPQDGLIVLKFADLIDIKSSGRKTRVGEPAHKRPQTAGGHTDQPTMPQARALRY
jgi:hypothetical protein